ncbi:DUF1801 domain-containing protein [Thalassotalea sediminis]|uniref:DUF1801 domain-containing protein n=1 Tax=Thalassotalea sediminis TaxID=1759089 RepID=UPI002574022C|nr:DUF1801 domain-containing protein [Thalassotalea sediminis]
MVAIKTQPTKADVLQFISSIENETRRNDALILVNIFTELSGFEPVMWGNAIIGFGEYHYNNSQGKQRWMLTGFSPRKQNLSLYIMQGFDDYQAELGKIGNIKTAKSCLYIKQLAKINMSALKHFLAKAIADMKTKYP